MLPPEDETTAVFVWCEGTDHGPSFFLDGEEQEVMPRSEDGQAFEVVTDSSYAGWLEIEAEQGPRSAQWAFAVGVTPEENASVDTAN